MLIVRERFQKQIENNGDIDPTVCHAEKELSDEFRDVKESEELGTRYENGTINKWIREINWAFIYSIAINSNA